MMRKKAIVIIMIQMVIYVSSIIGAFMNRGVITNWPSLLLLFGICIGNFVPIEYRTSFNSTDPGIILKNHTRRLENIIYMIITCLVIVLVIDLDMV